MSNTADAINPAHYKHHPSGVQIIELTRHMDFCLGNAFKYVARAMHKHTSPSEDYKKALWYVQEFKECMGDKMYMVGNSLWTNKWEDLQANAAKFFEYESADSVLRDIFGVAYYPNHRGSVHVCISKLKMKIKCYEEK